MTQKESEVYYEYNDKTGLRRELTWDFILEQLDRKRWNGNPPTFFNKLNEQLKIKKKGRLI